MQKHDPALDTLLDLDGLTLVVDPDGGHWVRFVVTQVPSTPQKPHGLDYSLCMDQTESGWWDSTTLIPWQSRNPAARRIIVTAFER